MSNLIDAQNVKGLKEFIANMLYPVGSRYVQLQGMPEPSTFGGTWELDSNYNNKALWCANSSNLGTSLAGSLPNILAETYLEARSASDKNGGIRVKNSTGAFGEGSTTSTYTINAVHGTGTSYSSSLAFNASSSNGIYSASAGANVVRPTSTTIKLWQRTA